MNPGFALWLPPLVAVAFLSIFARILWPWQDKSTKDKGESTERHSDRVYKNFEFFVSVTPAIEAGMGYLRFEKYDNARVVGEQAMHGLGMLELAVATFVSLFIIIHQGSKIRRRESTAKLKFFPRQMSVESAKALQLQGFRAFMVAFSTA